MKLELTPVNSTNRIPFLTTGKVDLVISSLGKNPEREAVIDFSAPYAPFYLGVFGPEDAAVASLEDLNDKTISVTRGSIEDIELSNVAPKGATFEPFMVYGFVALGYFLLCYPISLAAYRLERRLNVTA